MAQGHFIPRLEPGDKPFPRYFKISFVEAVIKDSFEAPTIIAFGAVLQSITCAILPLRWAFVPAAAIILNAIASTTIQTLRFRGVQPHVVSGKVAAVLPSPETGLHGPKPNKESFVVFHIGFQFNHPLGMLAPGVKEMGEKALEIFAEAEKKREEYGLIGMTRYKAAEKSTNSTSLTVMYFKDIEGVHRFAHSDIHRRGWEAFKDNKYPHLGFYHETFTVQPGGHEALYLNCYPVLLGRATVKAKTDEGEKFVSTLVDATQEPLLRTQWARLHRDPKGQLKEDFFE